MLKTNEEMNQHFVNRNDKDIIDLQWSLATDHPELINDYSYCLYADQTYFTDRIPEAKITEFKNFLAEAAQTVYKPDESAKDTGKARL